VFIGKRVPNEKLGDLMDCVMEQAMEHRDRIIWLPALSHAQLYPFVQNAEAVVLPSHVDNFPNACIESMAFKRIVIGTYGNGFEQLITHQKSGFLCEPGDQEGLLRTINDVLALSPMDRLNVGRQAAERIELLRPDIVVTQLVDLYLDVIDRKAGRSTTLAPVIAAQVA
jgi:glycosyltransferase involved in cell wall biosynthesis